MEENTPGRKAVEQNCQTESFNQKRLLFARFHSKATAANPNKKKNNIPWNKTSNSEETKLPVQLPSRELPTTK